jgi:hypothetical protein
MSDSTANPLLLFPSQGKICIDLFGIYHFYLDFLIHNYSDHLNLNSSSFIFLQIRGQSQHRYQYTGSPIDGIYEEH